MLPRSPRRFDYSFSHSCIRGAVLKPPAAEARASISSLRPQAQSGTPKNDLHAPPLLAAPRNTPTGSAVFSQSPHLLQASLIQLESISYSLSSSILQVHLPSLHSESSRFAKNTEAQERWTSPNPVVEPLIEAVSR